jgi:hypothetical protein
MQLNRFCIATQHQVPVAKALLESLSSLDLNLANDRTYALVTV